MCPACQFISQGVIWLSRISGLIRLVQHTLSGDTPAALEHFRAFRLPSKTLADPAVSTWEDQRDPQVGRILPQYQKQRSTP